MSDEELHTEEGGDREIDPSAILEAFGGDDAHHEEEEVLRRNIGGLEDEDPWEMDTNLIDDENNW